MGFEVVVRGGTVVGAGGAGNLDVGVTGGRIAALEPSLAVESAGRVVDATGLLVLPGVIDVHTHTRIATDAEPDRFFRDSVAAAFGGTTTFLAFNNPGTGVSEAGGRSLIAGLREWRAATAGDSAIDFGLSAVVTAAQADPARELAALVDAGVPTFKAFMVYDFGVDDRTLLRLLGAAGRAGGMLQVHCENATILQARTAAHLEQGETAPRFHAASRPPYVEAEATYRAIALARAADAPLYVVHLSSGEALRHVRDARAAGLRVHAETCPHYLALDETRYFAADEEAIRYVISPPLRSSADRNELWAGLAAGDLDLVATDHVPDRLAVEKAARGRPFPEISNGAPGIETLLAVVHGEGVGPGRISIERLVDLLATTPARLFGLERKGAIEIGRDADLVLFDPGARRTIRAAELHHTSDYTPYEGLEMDGAVRSVLVRGADVIRDGRFVGRRGFGQFQERRLM